MKKNKITLIALSIISAIGLSWFIKPLFGRNGKKDVAPIVSKAEKMGFPCEWVGFVKSRKTGIFQIYLACDVSNLLQGTNAKNQDELMSEIESKVISGLIPEVPVEEKLSIAFISQVDVNAVLCTDVRNKKIHRSWYDSYDNYCMP